MRNDSFITRRGFMKASAALCGSAALAGCSKDDSGRDIVYLGDSNVPKVPEIKETIIPGAAPHNCGGRCQLKAYVREVDGRRRIVRFVTDESPEVNLLEGSDVTQKRACVRCRSNSGFLYRADRLRYPLKQTKRRGDIDGFKRISWQIAFEEIGAELKRIRDTYGAETLQCHHASGDGIQGMYAPYVARRLLNLLGGQIMFRSNYSFPSIIHAASFTVKSGNGHLLANGRQDALNAEQIILWSHNPAETIFGTNTTWYIQQAKETGAKIISIDTRYSKTAATIANEFICPIPGTDPAIILAIIYHLLDKQLAQADITDGKWLDFDFLKKHVFGFFDEPSPTILQAGVTNYFVPKGASLSAYIFGNDRRLASAGLNAATSVYPDTIGYNVNTDDELYGKQTPIYGQTPKTPEWAEKISGVSATVIKALAESLIEKKTTMYYGGGWQRQNEGEQGITLIMLLGFITKNFGEKGRSCGIPINGLSDVGTASQIASALIPSMVGNAAAAKFANIYDSSKLTAPAHTYNGAIGTYQVFLWPDALENGGTGKSKWNDGQVKKLNKGIKALLNFGGNTLINQNGDARDSIRILADKSKCELIVSTDLYMVPSCAISDYVLPAATAFERMGTTGQWLEEEYSLFSNKAVEPEGESLSEFDIADGIAKTIGIDFSMGKTYEEWIQTGWEQVPARAAKCSFEQLKKTGIFYSEDYRKNPPTIHYKNFRLDPSDAAFAPMPTPSKRVEAYSQAMIEDYEARGYDNIDTSVNLVKGVDGSGNVVADSGIIFSKNMGSSANGCFAYPIPMYIPVLEGRHACDSDAATPAFTQGTPINNAVTNGATKHPDITELNKKGYKYTLQTFHLMYRSHSTHNKNAKLNEFYKRDLNGNPSCVNPEKAPEISNGLEKWDIWADNAYEPIWINPADIAKFAPEYASDPKKAEGKRVKITNDRGSIYASVHVTERTVENIFAIGQGSWVDFGKNLQDVTSNDIDRGGCANTLTSLRPTRLCQGMSLASNNRVKIELA